MVNDLNPSHLLGLIVIGENFNDFTNFIENKSNINNNLNSIKYYEIEDELYDQVLQQFQSCRHHPFKFNQLYSLPSNQVLHYHYLCVDPKITRQYIGSLLMGVLVKFAKENKYNYITAYAENMVSANGCFTLGAYMNDCCKYDIRTFKKKVN